MFCGKCGVEVPEEYEFCMNCGAKLEQPIKMVIQSEPKKKKKWIIPLILIVTIMITLTTIYYINDNKNKSGLYNNIAWGTSFDDIKTMIEKESNEEPLISDDKTMLYQTIKEYNGDKDISALIIYICKYDGTLYKINVFIYNGDGSNYTSTEFFEKYEKKLTELYGGYKENILGKEWTTPKSKIESLHLSGESLVFDYQDITTLDD